MTPDIPTPDPAGPVDALGNAMSKAPETAMQGLTQAMNQVQQAFQNAVQAMNDIATQGPAMLATHAPDALAHLPEVLP